MAEVEALLRQQQATGVRLQATLRATVLTVLLGAVILLGGCAWLALFCRQAAARL